MIIIHQEKIIIQMGVVEKMDQIVIIVIVKVVIVKKIILVEIIQIVEMIIIQIVEMIPQNMEILIQIQMVII